MRGLRSGEETITNVSMWLRLHNHFLREILPINSTGIKTHRDHFVVDIDDSLLRKRIEDFRNLSLSNEIIAGQYNLHDTRDWNLSTNRSSLAANPNWETSFAQILYRPLDTKAYFHHDNIVELPRYELMYHMLAGDNLGIATTRTVEIGRGWEHVLCSNKIIQHHTVSLKETNYLFPLFLYPDPNLKGLFDTNE